MADLKISQLPSLAESDIAANDELAVVDSSAAQTSKVEVKALIEKGLTLVDPGSVPSGAIAGLPLLSVDTGQLVGGAVTYDKIDSNDIGRGLNVDTSAGNIGISNSVTAGSKGGIVFNEFGLVTGTQNILSSELPVSTTSAVGGVSVSTGLSISGAGALSIAPGGVTYDMFDAADVGRGLSIDTTAGNIGISNSITAGSKAGVSYNSQGLITGVSALIPSTDLPKAGTSASAIGGIFVPTSGSGLTLDTSTGELKVDSSGLTASQIGIGAIETNNLDTGAVTDIKVDNVSGTKLIGGTVTYDKIDANDIGRGLSVDTTAGNIGLSNSVSAGSKAGISYDQYGQITSVAALIPASDLPAATTSALGAISVSNGLAVTAGGALSVSGITNAMLGADSVKTLQIEDNAVTNDKIIEVSGAKVTGGTLSPNALSSANVTNGLTVSAGNLQIDNSITAGSFAGISYSSAGLITGVSALVPSANLPIASSTALGAIKVGSNFSIDSSTGVLTIDTDGISQSNLSDDCVGTNELAPGAVDDTALGTNLSGAKIQSNTLPAASIVSTDLDRSINLSNNKIGINNAITAATHSGIAFNSEGLITGTSSILSTELPIASASAVGAVSVASNSGLAVTAGGALSLATTTTGQTINGFVYNDFGQITGATNIASGDLPKASTTAIGAVKIPTSSAPLAVDASGTLTISPSTVTAGTNYTKVDVNAQGLVTNAGSLTGTDIPDHSAALLTSGTIPIARIGPGEIDKTKFSNESTTIFGSINQTGFPSGTFSGQLFFDSVEEDLYLYDGAAWQPVTTLTKGSLKFAGTYDCSTSTVAAVSASGAAIGLTVGQQLPTPSSTTDGSYVIVSVGGSPVGIPDGPTGQLTPPDYILSVSNSTGSSWVEIDLSTTTSNPTAANVTVTGGWGGSASTVQTALAELASTKIGVGGGNITGVLKIENAGSLQWEGSVNAYETTLTAVDPASADRTLTLPDISGTLITDSDSGTVTSAMVSNDLNNSNLAANASIAFTKLASLTAGNILVGNSSNEVASVAMTGHVAISDSGATTIQGSSIVDSMITGTISASKLETGTTSNKGVLQLVDSTSSSSTTLAATGASVKAAYDLANTADVKATAAAAKSGDTFTGNVIISDAKELRFGEVTSTGSNYISFKAPDSIGSDISLVWPDNAPSPGQILKANASNANQLEWSSDAIDVAAGNLTGTTLASNVVTSSLTTVGTLGSLTVSGTITGDVTGDLTGNADTATTLATARAINGVSFNGSADITVTADASTLSGTSLASSITGSSLTSVGTLVNLTVTNTIAGSIDGNAATATALASARTIGGTSFDGTGDIDISYANLTNKPTIPTDNNQLSNGANYVTSSIISSLDAGNLSSGTIPIGRLGSSGSPSSSTFLAGDNSWQTVTGTTINNNADNRLITGSGTANTLEAEANLTFDGTNLDLGDDKKIRLGDSAELSLYTRGIDSNSIIEESGSGVLFVLAPFLRISDNGFNNSAALFQTAGSCELSYAGSKKIETTSSGVTITGTAIADNFSGNGSAITHLDLADATNTGQIPVARLGTSGTASNSTFLRGDNSWQTISTATPAGSNGEIQYYHNGALAAQSGFTIDNSTGDVYIAGASAGLSWDKSANQLSLASGAKAKFGSGSNYIYIHNNPSAARPELYINNSNPFTLTASGGDIAEIHQTGEVILKGDFLLRDGTNTKIEWDKSADSLIFDSQTKLKLGSSSEIFHDGSGNLKIDTGNDTEFDISGTQRLKVNSQGATITGTCTATVGFSGSAANLTNVNAESVDVTLSSTNANHYPLFASSNGSGQAGNTANAQDVLADGNLFYNPSTNVLTAGSFSGSGANLTNLPAPTPAGSNTQIQFNNSGSLGASSNLTFDGSALKVNSNDVAHAGNVGQGGALSGTSLYAGWFYGNGVQITGLDASKITTGTLNQSHLNFINNGVFTAVDGSNLVNLTAANITSGGTLPALDGSNLTNLPASGGTVDLYTSSGSGVTAGQPVYVDANGKAVAVSGSSTAKQPINKYVNEAGNWVFHNPPSSTSGGAPGSGIGGHNISYGYSQALCTISGVTYIVIVYADQTNSTYSYYRVGKFDTTNVRTITWGTATAFYSNASPSPQVVNMGNTGRFVLCSHPTGSWNSILFWAATINTSGLSLTINASQQQLVSGYTEYTGPNYTHGRFCQKNDNFCFYAFSNHQSYVKFTQIQWSGSTSSFTAVDPDYTLGTSWYYNGSGEGPAISFNNVGGSSGIVAITGPSGSSSSNSGNFKAVTAAAPADNQTWTSLNYAGNESISGRPWGTEQVIGWISSTKFYVAYVENKQSWDREDEAHIVIANSNSIYGIASIAQNTITTGSEKAAYNTLWAGWDSGTSRLVISYTQKEDATGTNTWYPHTNTATLSGSTGITIGTTYKLAMPTGDGSSVFTVKTDYGQNTFFQILLPKEVTPHPADNTCFIQIAGVGGGSTSDRGWIQFLEHKDNVHDGASFIGFAKSSISAGAEGTINVTGSTNDQVSGLTAGSIYYIGVGGNLSTTPVSPTTRVGIALSSTKILVGA